MRKTIHILHKPTNTYLCEDGQLRRGYSSCGTKDDTLVYRTVGHALRRLNTRKPRQKIRDDFINDMVLDVVETDVPGGFNAYRLDRHGNMVDDGHG
jgi:hypothetical protein